MIIKSNQEVILTPDEIRDILIAHLHSNHNISGIFDVKFVVKNKPIPSRQYPQDSIDRWVFDGVQVWVNENENIQK
jgi:hypothetical protein